METLTKEPTFNIDNLIRGNIRSMKPYSSARDEFKGEAEIFLDANENPYPTNYNRYPDPLQLQVKKKLGKLKGAAPENIFLGNGSDEGIDLLIRAFCEPNRDSILITEPTYGMYAVCAEVNAVNIQKVTLTEDFDLDVDSILQKIDTTTRIIFLCSPNNPTGNLLSREKVADILSKFNGIVVVDEAYIDFSKSKSFVKSLKEFPNLVVLQTFSKAWGLAALRLGMCFASKEIIDVLNKIKYPYNVNIVTQQVALAALKKPERKEKAVKEIIKQRKLLAKELSKLSVTEHVYPSDSNFLLARMTDAPDIYHYLMNKKIIVRDRSKVTLCDNCIRVTVGTPSENKRLIKALKKL
jgi:histidinol-phosphate aminotransferase